MDAFSLLWHRRSTTANCLGEPGPDPKTLDDILTVAARVPDHRRVTPFRFIVLRGDRRVTAGQVLATAFRENNPDADDAKVDFERTRFARAPVVIVVVSNVDRTHRTPEWEQVLCAGAVCQNLLLAANAKGFAAQWLTEWYAYDASVALDFGLAGSERFAGFIYIGTATEDPLERARPDMQAIVTEY